MKRIPHIFLILFGGFAEILSAQTVSFLAPVVTLLPDNGALCNTCTVSADFNGDGKQDIAWLGGSGSATAIGVELGNGDGSFQLAASSPFFASPSGQNMKILSADFNGDGHQDLLVAGPTTFLYLGNGDGAFRSAMAVTGCSATALTVLPGTAIADFNGDNKPDLVCGSSILLGNGDGTFRAGVVLDPGASNQVVVATDLNHDGRPDLVMQQLSGRLLIALGNGDGTFGADLAYPVNDALYGNVAADFNGDGKVDLVSYSSTENALIFTPGNGDGTFGAAIPTALNGIFEASSVADFNSDGKPDLLTTSGAVLAGNGDGTFRFPVFFSQYAFPISGDFNNDGIPDVAVLSEGQTLQLSVLLNDSPGDGLLTAGVSAATYSWSLGPMSVVSAFGTNLASDTETATSYPAQTTLGGIRVHLGTPPNDTLAPLIFVSKSQINYLLQSSAGFVPVSIEHVGSPFVAKGIGVQVTPKVVSFYTVGVGVAAATAVRVAPGGVQTQVPVFSCTAVTCTAAPIDVSGDPVYVSLFGTGFDTVGGGLYCGRGTPGTYTGGVTVTYAGPQQQIPGLDQVNLLLSPSLKGAGMVSITCETQPQLTYGLGGSGTPAGPASNPIQIYVQ